MEPPITDPLPLEDNLFIKDTSYGTDWNRYLHVSTQKQPPTSGPSWFRTEDKLRAPKLTNCVQNCNGQTGNHTHILCPIWLLLQIILATAKNAVYLLILNEPPTRGHPPKRGQKLCSFIRRFHCTACYCRSAVLQKQEAYAYANVRSSKCIN